LWLRMCTHSCIRGRLVVWYSDGASSCECRSSDSSLPLAVGLPSATTREATLVPIWRPWAAAREDNLKFRVVD
jgi:hypothetical protein